jgi:ribonuclease D
VLIELAAWRESEAQSRDVPRSRVLKDDALIEIAQAAPSSLETLQNLRVFPRSEKPRSGADILAAVARGLARDPATLPFVERERRNGNGATVELLKVLLRLVSEETGVAAKMIATVDDLEAIAAYDDADVAALRGWRRAIFGGKALQLKSGRLALAIERGRVVTLDWEDADSAVEAG